MAELIVPTSEFKEIPNYEGYYAKTDGTIWSDWNNGKIGGRSPYLHLLKGKIHHKDGHLYSTTRWSKPKMVAQHHLVLWAYVGTCPPGMECRHLNDIPTDNRPENLCWGTRQENIADAVRNGARRPTGRTRNFGGQVRNITINGKTQSITEWAKEMGISRSIIYNRLYNGMSESTAVMTPYSRGKTIHPRQTA